MTRINELLVLCALVFGAAVTLSRDAAQASHESGSPRPAHLPQSVAHTAAVPTSGGDISAWGAMQNAYSYWNDQAAFRTLHTYSSPVTFSGAKHDLIVDFVAEQPFGQPPAQACVYDFAHCQTVPADDPNTPSVNEAGYAWFLRWDDINVGHVVWDATQYALVGDNYSVENTNFKIVAARHELGHDNHLGDHDTSYDGLMCHANACTRRASANATELNAAQSYLLAKPVPPSSIAVLSYDSTSVTVQFSGHGNADNLTPWFSPFLQSWTAKPNIPTGSTTYTFSGLVPNTTYNFRMAANKSGQAVGSSHWATATTLAIGRVANLTLDASSSTQFTLTWSSLPGAVSYERCVAPGPNEAPGNWICASVSGTSNSASLPSTSSKAVWYYAIRGVDANGNKGALSNRGAISRFNETISGTAYKSYHTVYKNSSSQKRVNGFNKHSSGSRWLVFNNGNAADNKSKSVAAGSKMFTAASLWDEPDNSGAFGPFITTVESPNSSFLPQDSIAVSTVCMAISGGCN